MVDTSELPGSLAPILPSLTAPLPRTLGGYELLERAGRGATAEVWLARRPVALGGVKPCALKIIHAEIAANPRHRRMFVQEGRLALKMSHANVVSVFDVGEDAGRLFMALEWVDGVDLRRFAAQVQQAEGGLHVAEVCTIVRELLQGLRHAHELEAGGVPLGVIHRDVAPHNVMVSASGEIKLGDFGIAHVCGEWSSGQYVKGRTRYMAPEHLHGEPCQASDLFAVGAILHELLEGRRFRDGLERSPTWYRVVSEARVPPLLRSDVPPPLEALRVALLEPEVHRRIGTASEALAMLLRCPPWSAGAASLRSRYRRCVGLPQRTSRALPPPGAVPAVVVVPREVIPTRAIHREPTRTLPPIRRVVAVPSRARPSWRQGLRLRPWRWLAPGVWSLCAALGFVATALWTVPRTGPAAGCVDEPPPSSDRTHLRVRSDGQPHAQVRIDEQVVDVGPRNDCWLSPGPHRLEWRRRPGDAWKPVGAHTLVSAKEHLLRVGEDGLAISAYDP